MNRMFVLAIQIATVLTWALAAVDVLPWGPELDPDASLFVVAAACVSSYAWITKAHSRPAVEVYLAGKAVGRREAMLEQECENVSRLQDQPPSLRIVSGR